MSTPLRDDALRHPRRYTAALTREGELYVAQCLELDVASQGSTVEEALANLREALELYLEDAPAEEARPPTAPIIATVEVVPPSAASPSNSQPA